MALSKQTRDGLSQALGHTFADPALLMRALSHRSAVASHVEGYERLEFLGDRVLGLYVADLLLQEFPEDREGHLSRRLNALVRREALAEIAVEAGLVPHVQLGRGEEEDGARNNPAILADVCEAVIAALYLDGGPVAAQRFIERYWRKRLVGSGGAAKDAKSALQEWGMARGVGLPAYKIVERSGPDHAPRFIVRVSLEQGGAAEAGGSSKRLAEQRAAEALLNQLQAKD